jgi:hypothetical protein
MIITRLTGGLGNQMFQYAAGLALAEQRRTVLKLDVSWFREYAEYEAHNRYALSCLNVTEQFATQEEIDRVRGIQLTRTERWTVALARALRLRRYVARHASGGLWHYPPHGGFYPEFSTLPDSTYLDGMFQSEQFFASFATILRLHFSFRYPPQPAVEAMAQRIRENGPSVAVHFRRGDYVRNSTFSKEIGALGLDYYDKAIAHVRALHPTSTLYIFSDDIDGVEREFRPPGPHVFVRATQPWHAYDKIRLMGLCHHAIISNSTFAWWAAWLNPSPTKLVVAPDPWFADRRPHGDDLVTASWIRIPR